MFSRSHFSSLAQPVEVEALVCVFDLTGYVAFSRAHSNAEVFRTLQEFYRMTAPNVEAAGGILIKYIGDAGLAVFPREVASDAIVRIYEMKKQVDRWLKTAAPGSQLAANFHVGPVCIGPILGYGGQPQVDVVGETVNTCFTLGRKDFLLSPQAFRSLKPEARKIFKKYTPPITYKLV